MALTYTFSPAQPLPFQKVTVTLAGLSATTTYQTTIKKPSGGTQVVTFTTDGSGGASFTYSDSSTGQASFDTMTAPAAGSSQGTATCKHGA